VGNRKFSIPLTHLTGNSETDPMGSGKEQKRTLKLLSEHIIWDFSGNVWEMD